MDSRQCAFRRETFFPNEDSVIPAESLHQEGDSRSGSGALRALGLLEVLAAGARTVSDL